MVLGADKDDNLSRPLDPQGGGQSAGLPASGELEGNAYNPLGNPGQQHWQASYIGEPGLDERGNIFFAAVEMTRMPMVVTDPNLPDNPIVFVNGAFKDLTGYRNPISWGAIAAALVVEFSEMLVRTLGDKVNLRLDLRPGLPPCMLDPTHVELALLNVLVNARDAMPQGGEVTVATAVVSEEEAVRRHQLPPGQYVSISSNRRGQSCTASRKPTNSTNSNRIKVRAT